MLKVMTVVGTRPELIKLSQVIQVLDRNFEHILVHTGQNFDYELNEIFFEDLGIRKPDYFLGVAGGSPMDVIGNILSSVDQLLLKTHPEAFLVYGDTNSCLCVIAAKRRHIPIFHLEAGNRCFDQRVPEEMNRKIIDHTSDINFPLTEHARTNLLHEGIAPDTIIKVGSCMGEVYRGAMPRIQSSSILDQLQIKPKQFIVFSCHREENVDKIDSLRNVIQGLDALAEHFQIPIIFSTHPRTRKSMELNALKPTHKLVQIHKPFSFSDYNHLQQHSMCTISDSGTITEESAILGFPAITIRDAHERLEGMDSGIVTMTSLQPHLLIQAVQFSQSSDRHPIPVADYTQSSPSWTIANAIMSYTKFVKRKVWNE